MMIKWNDGLNIGVKTIDDDHKELFNIINDFSKAVEEESSQSIFENIFFKLEESAMKHCFKEEALLKECKYEELDGHKIQHQAFIETIIDLKEKLYLSKNYVEKEQIAVFLTDWLMNHIINEDMLLFDTLKRCGLIEDTEDRKSFIHKLIKETSNTFSFTKRVFISALIPLIGMLVLGFIIIWNDYDKYESIKNISNITHTIYDINSLTHLLQEERGLSSGYISAKKDKYKNKLNQQRKLVDKSCSKFIKNLQKLDLEKNYFILRSLETLKTDMTNLKNIRKLIDDKTISNIKEINFYTNMINNILFITSKIMLLNTDKEISYSLSVLTSLLNLKDIIGQERAQGMILIEQKSSSTEDFKVFIELFGSKKTYYDNLNHITTQEDKKNINNLFTTTITNKILNYETEILNNNYITLDSKIWFNATTNYMNILKEFINNHIKKTDILINNNLNTATQKLKLWYLYIFIILFITIFIVYIFDKSTKIQILELIKGMNYLALGGRDLRLQSNNSKDEMSQIYDAYETTRQKLLEGDIYTQLYLNQERLRANHQKRINKILENEVIHDGLTGLFNRRYYNDVIKKELSRAKREKLNFTFVMLDIDFFKYYNDTYGHDKGDNALKTIAELLQKKLNRGSDFCFRLGGEEFAFFFTGFNLEESLKYTQDICTDIEKLHIVHSQNKASDYVTASFGLVNINMKNSIIDEHTIYVAADEALYQAKDSGRNCIYVSKQA